MNFLTVLWQEVLLKWLERLVLEVFAELFGVWKNCNDFSKLAKDTLECTPSELVIVFLSSFERGLGWGVGASYLNFSRFIIFTSRSYFIICQTALYW